MVRAAGARGLIAVDKMGTKVLLLDPVSYATEVVRRHRSPATARTSAYSG
jgi:hypothetical protein